MNNPQRLSLRVLEFLSVEFPAVVFLLTHAVLYALKMEFLQSALLSGVIAHLLSRSMAHGGKLAELQLRCDELTELAHKQTQINAKSVEAVSVWAEHVRRDAGKVNDAA